MQGGGEGGGGEARMKARGARAMGGEGHPTRPARGYGGALYKLFRPGGEPQKPTLFFVEN